VPVQCFSSSLFLPFFTFTDPSLSRSQLLSTLFLPHQFSSLRYLKRKHAKERAERTGKRKQGGVRQTVMERDGEEEEEAAGVSTKYRKF